MMGDTYPAEDRGAGLLERRWFAADRAALALQVECEALARNLEKAQAAWRSSTSRLAQLESLRDALGDELAVINERQVIRSYVSVDSAAARRSAA